MDLTKQINHLFLLLVAQRNEQESSYYMPSTQNEAAINGLSALQQEGVTFWTDLKDTALLHFRNVLHVTDRQYELEENELEDSLSDCESSDSDLE